MSVIDRGHAAFLEQAHRNNWQQYLASLRHGATRGWDLCILTASDERQAAMYRRQLEWRRPAGLLPANTRFLVVPDPPGRRIGSGGATLRVLTHLWQGTGTPEGTPGALCGSEPPASLGAERILLIHSGGDSRRLPHCSAAGKLFARVPRLLPDGRASTVFDEFLISLSGLAAELPPGVLIASGDVLLIFDHLQLSFQRGGVIGVAAAAPMEMGHRHGVYVSGDGGHRVRAYLHKPADEDLARWDAVGPDGTVQIDTGLVWWDVTAAQKLARLAADPTVAGYLGGGPASTPGAQGPSDRGAAAGTANGSPGLNLYGDLLLPLAQSTGLERYLADASDGPIVPGLTEARQAIWATLRQTPFTVERLQPAVFVHFGTSAEYWQMAAADGGLAALCGWAPQAAAWIAGLAPVETGRLVVANAAIEQGATVGPSAVLVNDSRLSGHLTCAGAGLISGVRTGQSIELGDRVVLHQMPVNGRFVTQVFGLLDNPKRVVDDPQATYLNRSWDTWLAEAQITPEALWPDVPQAERTLWNARLFPLGSDREESLSLALPLQAPSQAPRTWLESWRRAPRTSLAEAALLADGQALTGELAALEDYIAACRFWAAVKAEEPAALAAQWFARPGGDVAGRSRQVEAWLLAADPLLRVRGYKALAEATGSAAWEDRAFETLAATIRAAVEADNTARQPAVPAAGAHGEPGWSARAEPRKVRVQAAARVDFGGGWSDTPPYSLERGGAVLNAALQLRGAYPVICEGEWLPTPRLVLESRDLDSTLEPTCAGDVLSYANPADPFALHKAALVLRGVVPYDAAPGTQLAELFARQGRGLRLSTSTTIPRGSGLGTSSIMAGALLSCLTQLLDPAPAPAPGQRPLPASPQLFDEVLALEQMLTTGGGWQDQVGGLVGGIKLITTPPGLPQRITIEPLRMAPEVEAEFAERLVLVYTGQQRLAKNLLRAIMSRWIGRERKMVWILEELARLAHAMRRALASGDVTGFGALMGEHWVLNKRMDPGCSNPLIDRLFSLMEPYAVGAKLAGAGGGGFAIVIARDAEAARQLPLALHEHFQGTPVSAWPCAMPAHGMVIEQGAFQPAGART